MAFTMTKVSGPHTIGNRWEYIWTAVPDNSYATGGESLTRQELGFAATADPTFHVEIECNAGYQAEYDHANQKVKIYNVAAHTHDLFLKNADQADAAGNRVNAATDKLGGNTGSNITVAGLAAGGSAHGGVVGIAAAAAAEVANTTDLSATVTLRIHATGKYLQ